jgi:hypothetical protein
MNAHKEDLFDFEKPFCVLAFLLPGAGQGTSQGNLFSRPTSALVMPRIPTVATPLTSVHFDATIGVLSKASALLMPQCSMSYGARVPSMHAVLARACACWLRMYRIGAKVAVARHKAMDRLCDFPRTSAGILCNFLSNTHGVCTHAHLWPTRPKSAQCPLSHRRCPA